MVVNGDKVNDAIGVNVGDTPLALHNSTLGVIVPVKLGGLDPLSVVNVHHIDASVELRDTTDDIPTTERPPTGNDNIFPPGATADFRLEPFAIKTISPVLPFDIGLIETEDGPEARNVIEPLPGAHVVPVVPCDPVAPV